MSFFAIFTITAASAINAAMPGPCFALTLARSARGGIQAGLLVTVGLGFAKLILCSVALAITQGVLVLSIAAFLWMKWIGVFMLVGLAIHMFKEGKTKVSATKIDAGTSFEHIVSGIMVGLSSPFNLIFCLSLLPQFLPAHGSFGTTAFPVVAAVLLGALLTYSATTLIGAATGGCGPGISRHIERLGALSMLGFAALAAAAPLSVQ